MHAKNDTHVYYWYFSGWMETISAKRKVTKERKVKILLKNMLHAIKNKAHVLLKPTC